MESGLVIRTRPRSAQARRSHRPRSDPRSSRCTRGWLSSPSNGADRQWSASELRRRRTGRPRSGPRRSPGGRGSKKTSRLREVDLRIVLVDSPPHPARQQLGPRGPVAGACMTSWRSRVPSPFADARRRAHPGWRRRARSCVAKRASPAHAGAYRARRPGRAHSSSSNTAMATHRSVAEARVDAVRGCVLGAPGGSRAGSPACPGGSGLFTLDVEHQWPDQLDARIDRRHVDVRAESGRGCGPYTAMSTCRGCCSTRPGCPCTTGPIPEGSRRGRPLMCERPHAACTTGSVAPVLRRRGRSDRYPLMRA